MQLTGGRPKAAGQPVIMSKDGVWLSTIDFGMPRGLCKVVGIVDTNRYRAARSAVLETRENAGFRRFIPENGLTKCEQMYGTARSHDGL